MHWRAFIHPARKWWFAVPVLLGGAVVAALVAGRRPPEQVDPAEPARTLRVVRVPVVDVLPRLLAYGSVRPGQVWQAVAEVRGTVLETHEHLSSGAMVRQGETLLRIDPAEYELAVAQFEADIAQLHSQLEELEAKKVNDEASLEIEQDSLTLAEAELARLESLAARKVVSASEVDQQNRSVLTQRQAVQRLRNALALVPMQRKALEASLAVKETRLAQAQLDLAKTVIEAPLDCRLGEVRIEPGQFVAAGQSLFEAHGTAVAELEAQVSLDRLRTLVRPELREAAIVAMDSERMRKVLDFDVTVRFRTGDFTAAWEGRVARLREQFDPRTRTVGLVVAVDRPYEQAIPGKRPPLVQGMYCEAELRGAVRSQQVVVPRAALDHGHVYVVDDGRRLRRRRVEVEFVQAGFACLRSGLAGGELLVVSDPAPAIEGMLVEPVVDEDVQARLVAEATGEERPPSHGGAALRAEGDSPIFAANARSPEGASSPPRKSGQSPVEATGEESLNAPDKTSANGGIPVENRSIAPVRLGLLK